MASGNNYSSRSSGRAERKLQITEFHGVDQSRGNFSKDFASSPDAVNFITRNGMIRTAGGVAQYGADIPLVEELYTDESLPRLFQAFFRDEDGNDYTKLIASFNRKIWAYEPETSTWTDVGDVSCDGCDMVCYRYQTTEWAIFTDGLGHAYYWDGAEDTFDDLNPAQGSTPIYFQQIALLYERLFGAVLQDVPDRIFWSDSFSPTNWEPNASLPDDGGGFLDVATFDGGRIRAIVPAFDDMLIFKDKSIHRISGTYPGEFQVSQIYGSTGTLAPRSIVNAGTYLYFLSGEGLCRYDGMTVASLKAAGDRRLKDAWAALNTAAIDQVCAAFYNNVIYLSVPLDSEESRNTHVIEYDIVENAYSIVELPGIDDFLVYREGMKETLLAISWNKVYLYDSGALFYGKSIEAVWTSPEIDCGTMASKKQTGYFYMVVEATSLTVGQKPAVKISMISNGKTRSKTIALNEGVNEIRKRLRSKGRAFRFRIENVSGDPLAVHRGFEVAVEEDFD